MTTSEQGVHAEHMLPRQPPGTRHDEEAVLPGVWDQEDWLKCFRYGWGGVSATWVLVRRLVGLGRVVQGLDVPIILSMHPLCCCCLTVMHAQGEP